MKKSTIVAVLFAMLGIAGCRDKSKAPVPAASASASVKPSADVVSEASEAAPEVDAGPSVVASGKVDGNALVERHLPALQKMSPVTVLLGKSPLELGEAICQAVVPKRRWDTPVLLKPNLCGFDGIRDPDKTKGDDGFVGRTTHVDFTRGVIHCLKKRGLSKITIAEGCGISHDYWEQVASRTGYTAMAKEEHVALVALDDDGVSHVGLDDGLLDRRFACELEAQRGLRVLTLAAQQAVRVVEQHALEEHQRTARLERLDDRHVSSVDRVARLAPLERFVEPAVA